VDGDEDADGEAAERGVFTPISSTSENRGVIIDAEVTLTPEELAEAGRLKRLRADTATIPTEKVAQILRAAGHVAAQQPAATVTALVNTMDRKANLRKRTTRSRRRSKHKHGIEMKVVNGALNDRVGVKHLQQCPEAQLERRLLLAQQWLMYGVIPGDPQ
jgi:hypothetical protein